MQQVNGVPVFSSDPSLLYYGLDIEPTWFSAQGGVYKCIERTTNNQVAIKKYLVEEDSPHQDMFVMPKELVENEIYSMTKCLHPNILKLLAVHLHQEFVYLVMPLCTGGSLQQYVFEHHLTVGQLVHIITSIASGLAKVHSHGYIHRDIKCDNIFLDKENNNIVIGDFGVVSISPAADSAIEEAGVVLFWSPELVQQQIVNHKVDVWALGIVILEVLNGGKAPYEDDKLDEDEIKERILEWGRPEYPPNLPSGLVDLLNRCLEVDPRSRWSASAILQHTFLKDYEPELLFPATRLDGTLDIEDEDEEILDDEEDVSSQSDTLEDNMMQDVEPILVDRKQLDTMEDIQCVEAEVVSVVIQPSPTTSFIPPPPPQQQLSITVTAPMEEKTPAKCRLPLPAFSVDHRKSAAVPVKEKIANVIRKRQTMTDANRSQGSRIPMLCILQQHYALEEAEPVVVVEEKSVPPQRLRSVKSVKLPARTASPPRQKKSLSGDNISPSAVAATPVLSRKPLTRSNTVPSRMVNALKPKANSPTPKVSNKRASTRSPLQDITKSNVRKPKIGSTTTTTTEIPTKKELPPKSSIYRHKRLPAGESRTARLMMGVSTNGRRQSFRQREESGHEKEELSPTLGHRFGKLFNNKDSLNPVTTKRRPMSFAASASSMPKYNSEANMSKTIPTPPPQRRSRRQSVPATSITTNTNGDDNNKKKSNHGIKSNVNILRVH
ncbi:unnamed protein product [Mucor hiemalis]